MEGFAILPLVGQHMSAPPLKTGDLSVDVAHLRLAEGVHIAGDYGDVPLGS